MSDVQPKGSFTGIKRERKTRLSIKIIDVAAKGLITVGGIGTICAVALVCVFLAIKVVPLFTGGSAERIGEPIALGERDGHPVHLASDEYRLMVSEIEADGRLRVVRSEGGELLVDRDLFPEDGPQPTAWSFLKGSDSIAVGFDDGSVRLGTFGYSASFILEEGLPSELTGLALGEQAIYQSGVVERTPEGQLRQQEVVVAFGDPIEASPGQAIRHLDHIKTARESVFVSVDEQGAVRLYEVREKKNLLTGKIRYSASRADLPAPEGVADARFVGLTGLADNVWFVWDDGRVVRVDCRRHDDIGVAEELDLVEGDATVTAARFINGKSTLLVGDSQGRVGAWFTRQADAERDQVVPRDGVVLERGHLLIGAASPVSSLGVSSRTRLISVGHDNGAIELFNVTTEGKVAALAIEGEAAPVDDVNLAPKDDGVLALAAGRLHFWSLDAHFHEVTPASLVLPVHYESREIPATIWQSSSGDDAFEPKFGLWPLVFGTLKATFYALVFGVPIALLAAIYTSEFLHPKAKSTVKPVIEMMASLPSVVLGFLAGIVIASWVEERAAGVLMTIVSVPFALLLGARLWQLVPRPIALRIGGWRLLFMLPMCLFGMWLGGVLGGPVERLLFAVDTVDLATGEVVATVYDMKAWLGAHRPANDGVAYESSPIAGWMVLFLPLAGMLLAFANGRWVAVWLRGAGAEWGEWKMALVDLVRFFAGCAAVVTVAWLLSAVASIALGDARSSELIGWLLLCLLPAGIAVGLTHAKVIKPQIGDAATPLWLTGAYVAVTLLIAWLLALGAIALLGPLGSYVDTYVQRNALVVGFIMGFAIIPIIYTISEDALSSVPEHLRSASLGAGATPWQTAIRVILPTAMSGVFSAIMIGLGRAVGETMIVLMAAGNTPVLSMNIFDGFRTLSANIAVELPEAPVDGTHYRVLFLAALVLFVMTFALNTVAESVRQKFRKRAFEL